MDAGFVRYWTPDGGQRKRRFDRATDARNFANAIEASKATGTFVDPRAGRMRMNEWAKRWLEGVRPDPETGEGPIKPKTFASTNPCSDPACFRPSVVTTSQA